MELIQIGRILGPHGLGGHVQVIAVGVHPDVLQQSAVWSVGFGPDAVMARRVEECREHITARGVSLIVRLDGVIDRTGAELLKGAAVFAGPDELGSGGSEDDEATDMIGYAVSDESGRTLGSVSDLLSMPAQDLLVVSRPGKPDAMVPYVPEIVLSLDAERKLIIVNPPEGLFD